MPTLDMYGIGASAITIGSLHDLGIPDPKGSYYPETKKVRLSSGKHRGLGPPRILWHWDFLRIEWREELRTFMDSVSGLTYIESRVNEEDDWAQFEAYYLWPDEDKDSFRRMDFDIWFTVVTTL
jgi:hypothetical protein